MTGIFRWIERHAEKTPDKPAILFEGETITYADFAGRVRAAAGALKNTYGIQPGDRVAYLGLGLPDAFYLLFACARIGAMFLPMNWRLAAPEHQFILGDSGATLLIADADHQARAEELQKLLPALTLAACDFEAEGWTPFWAAEAGEEPEPESGADDPVLLVYTSGTTGAPKGAVLTQGAITVNALNAIHANDMSEADTILNVLPLFHVGGLNVQSTPAFYAGATVIQHRRFVPAAVLAALRQGGITLAVLVPAMQQALMAEPDWAAAEFPDLRFVMSGSTIVPRPLIEAMAAKGIPLGQVYGSTETGPYATYLRADEVGPKAGSAGRVAIHCELRIVDTDDQVVAAGEAGEILIRGDNLFSEYWRNAPATREALRDGWHYTGDIGYQDDDGFLWVHDRKKDVIISGGENIYPAEVEIILHAMADVADGVVVGLADAKWGEVPVAVVQMNKGYQVEAAAFLARFEDKIANFKRPRHVVFTDSLPRNAMGKILKHQVREEINE
ncbi:MAG: AMP-binding protein [Rhodospirillaceae bacterium]|nr:AMP-binding protein [Rhodospirillaceae bacterium]MBT5837472.1 AMP-binding protein [Rhodospirillaceae bacterium]